MARRLQAVGMGGGPRFAIVVLAALVLTASCAAPAGTPRSSAQAPTGSATSGPVGATAAPLLVRIRSSEFTADSETAVVEALAASGIGTYRDPGQSSPILPLTASMSPLRFTEPQVHALALDAWNGGSLTGADLDAVAPVPADEPLTSSVLAGYVASADTPAGALLRDLMAGQDLYHPTGLVFPALALVFFASDVATDGGRLAAPWPSSTALSRAPLLAFVQSRGSGVDLPLVAAGGICSATEQFIDGTIHGLFDALRLATPANLPGRIVTGIWNWIVGAGETLVRSAVKALAEPVLGLIRYVATLVANVALQVAIFLPYVVHVTADPESVILPTEPYEGHRGRYKAEVTAGDLPDWPAVLADCAAVAGQPLPNFKPAGAPTTWSTFTSPAGAFLLRDSADPVLGANGEANLSYHTIVEPANLANGQANTASVSVEVRVERKELAQARASIANLVFGQLPGLIRGFVEPIFRPYLDGLLQRIDSILDARGRGNLVVTYHTPAPSPSPPAAVSTPASCSPTAGTSPGPLAPGTYHGTLIHAAHIASSLTDVVQHGTGIVDLSATDKGAVSGSWSLDNEGVLTLLSSGKQGNVLVAVRNGTISGSASAPVFDGTPHVTGGSDASAARQFEIPIHLVLTPSRGPCATYHLHWSTGSGNLTESFDVDLAPAS